MGFIPNNNVYPNGSIFVNLQVLLSNQVQFLSSTSRAIYDDIDFFETPFLANTNGLDGGEAGAPYESYGLRSTRTRQDIRRATKRFAGVVKGDVGAGGVLTPNTLSLVENVGTAMGAPLTIDDNGNLITFVPCVASKEKYTVPGSSPPRFAYRYYPTLAQQQAQIATSILWEPYTTTRTQTSRQYGQGQ